MENNNETLDLDIDELFKDTQEDIEKTEQTNSEQIEDTEKDEMTKAVSERINNVKKKTEIETQERLAKELGYNSYSDLQKANEAKIIEEAGLNETEINTVVEKLVEKRLASDSRLKKLEELEILEKTKFVTNQLNEINNLIKSTGIKYSNVDQLPKDTLEVWEKTGNLKQAFLATQGETLLMKSQNKATTTLNHLSDTGTPGIGTKKRLLTEYEKAIYRSVLSDITEEELSKKTVDIE